MRPTMKTVAKVLMNIHMNILALARGSCVLWSLVVIVGSWASTPPFSTSPFLPFSSISVSDMLMSVLSEALESGRSIEGERNWLPVNRLSREGDDWSSKSESAFIDAIAQPHSWLGEWESADESLPEYGLKSRESRCEAWKSCNVEAKWPSFEDLYGLDWVTE